VNSKKKANSDIVEDVIKEYDGLDFIHVKGAREHNLKNVNITIPRDKLTVITGLSGSGKSSLAFDTIFAEGQRRYVECLSPYARQFMGMMKKPDVDSVEGLSPAISIEQKTLGNSPRSTVGTVTEIYDYIRLLYAKIGTQFCVKCDIPVIQKSLDQIVAEIHADFDDTKIQILSPIIRARKGHYKELFEQLIKQGFTKARIDGEIKDLNHGMQLARFKVHDIEIVIDRLKIENNTDSEHRLSESLALALDRGDGTAVILYESNGIWSERLYSNSYSCPKCGTSYNNPAPNNFSFNSPYGACKTCDGLGETQFFSPDLLAPDKTKSLIQEAIFGVNQKEHFWLWSQIKNYAEFMEFSTETPLNKLTEEQINGLFYGKEISEDDDEENVKNKKLKLQFTGIVNALKHRYEHVLSPSAKKTFEQYMTIETCKECNGGRLKQESLFVRINNTNIHQLTSIDINDTIDYFVGFQKIMSKKEDIIARSIVKEIISRLEFLKDVGLEYMTLGRRAKTLSGGESQRIRLASQIGSKLVGITYVLDEPSIGLHQHDNDKLITSLKNLRDLGNTLIVVEHDRAMIEESDYLIDIGPGAGVNGGNIIFTDSPSEIKNLKNKQLENSLTASYLNNKLNIEFNSERRKGNGLSIKLNKANGNNLNDVTLNLPLGKLICITGMSGSGKSSLINDTLVPILNKYFFGSHRNPLNYRNIEGIDNIDKIIEIDQAPIGRTPRSNPATYTGLFGIIRDFYTMMPESKVRGYKSGRFSFNVKGGRCENCEGAGMKKIEMSFLPEVYVMCDVCEGKRYNNETLAVKFKEKSIADVLDMPVDEAVVFFKDIPKVYSKLQVLHDVGLGYIKLGQQAPTLSGGEAQRVKLATELSKKSTGKTLYLLDEPTTGLHFEDIKHLMVLINGLVDKGNSVVIIEHNLDVVKCADWIIDLGPGGGKNGGYIVAEGTPEDIVKNKKTLTGKYLKVELRRGKK